MRLPGSEKLEIIRLVEQSHLPARRTLDMLGIRPSGVISQNELRDRFEQAHEAASRCSGGPGIAIVLEDMLAYLEPVRGGR